MKNPVGFILALFVFFTISCKKNSGDATQCVTTLYGYNGISDPTGAFSPQTFGKINPATVAMLPPTGTFMSSIYTNQGAYNSVQNCYYVFEYYNSGSTQVLYKIDVSTGIVTIYNRFPVGASDYEGLVYNRSDGKLYCITNNVPSKVVEVKPGFPTATDYSDGSAVTITSAISTSISPVTSTVDDATGTLYFVLLDFSAAVPKFSIQKFSSGTATQIASGTDTRILGLRFNKSDNMLYAIRENNISTSSTFDFIKITPTGIISTVAPGLPFTVNNEFYSAAIDPCTNHYLLSEITDFTTSAGILYQLKISDGSNALPPTPTTGTYQGLEEAN